MSLHRKLLEANNKYDLIREQDKILIGSSAGIDSTALIYVLNDLKNFFKIEISCAYFDHSIRDDTELDIELLKSICKSLNLKLYLGKLKEDIPKNVSKESFLRDKRYEFLRKTKEKLGYNKIALAHHLDDLFETFLLFLIRSSFFGIFGFLPKQEDIIRPFYLASKDDIRLFVSQKNISYREDYTNFLDTYMRNKIRKDIVPIFKALNPNILNDFLMVIEALRDEHEFLEKNVRSLEKNNTVKYINSLDRALQRIYIKELFSEKSLKKIELIRSLLKEGKEVSLSKNKKILKKDGKLIIEEL